MAVRMFVDVFLRSIPVAVGVLMVLPFMGGIRAAMAAILTVRMLMGVRSMGMVMVVGLILQDNPKIAGLHTALYRCV